MLTCRLWIAALLSSASMAQVVAPVEIKDPDLRSLQSQNMDELRAFGAEIINTGFDYPFYLSRKLDIDEQHQKSADRRSIRFDRYNGKTVLAVTGNYYAAYSAERLNKDQRARATFLKVVLPILRLAVPRFQDNQDVHGYAFEISHHILGQVMGVSMERPENLLVSLPQDAAIKLATGKDESARQAALLKGEVFLNAEPVTIWLRGEGPQLAENNPDPSPEDPGSRTTGGSNGQATPANSIARFPKRSQPVEEASHPQQPLRDTSPSVLASLQTANDAVLATLVTELDAQAHFISYAAPSFITFRQGIYLELSLTTTVTEAGNASRYKLAALAFDDHISHLIRPVLGYFKDDPKKTLGFDGIGFSTTIHFAVKNQPSQGSQAIEFFFPFSALRCYEKYDCTGQQLIDSGMVLINGERVSLDLQLAEASAR